MYSTVAEEGVEEMISNHNLCSHLPICFDEQLEISESSVDGSQE